MKRYNPFILIVLLNIFYMAQNCGSGFFQVQDNLASSSNCKSCLQHCQVCENGSQCKRAQKGFFFNQQKKIMQSCDSCNGCENNCQVNSCDKKCQQYSKELQNWKIIVIVNVSAFGIAGIIMGLLCYWKKQKLNKKDDKQKIQINQQIIQSGQQINPQNRQQNNQRVNKKLCGVIFQSGKIYSMCLICDNVTSNFVVLKCKSNKHCFHIDCFNTHVNAGKDNCPSCNLVIQRINYECPGCQQQFNNITLQQFKNVCRRQNYYCATTCKNKQIAKSQIKSQISISLSSQFDDVIQNKKKASASSTGIKQL